MIFQNTKEADLSSVCESILELGREIPVWVFKGNLGAGKTTLIKGLAQKIGIKENITSPTFSYVNTYDDKIHHFDCYRLKSIEEALDFGLEEYLDSGVTCWIEWPEIVEPLLPLPYLEIQIKHTSNNSRDITIKVIK